MHRAFRSPILAIHGAARARIYTTATATGQAASADNKLDQRQNPTLKLNRVVDTDGEMRSELSQIKNRLKGKPNVKDIQNLVEVHEMMKIYRRYRDDNGSVNASEPIHAILTTLRLRGKVLKPVISTVRRQIMGSQNAILSQYLNEIADDLVAGRSYASHFALSYMLTAFSTMENNAQASAVWKRLVDEGAKKDLVEKLDDPRVVSAALRSSDPSVVNLVEFERIYKDTTEKHGRYILADDALAMGYLRFKEFNKAVEIYASICEHYNIDEWSASIVRLHNQILTQCTDINIAKVFFDTATSSESFIQLHPSAAARYIEHYYQSTNDVEGVVDIYERAMHRLNTQTQSKFEAANCLNITSEALKCVVNQHYALKGPVDEAQVLIARIIGASPSQPLVLNTVLSFVSKAWPTSEYIATLQQKYFEDVDNLGFDTIRVLLNSAQSLTTHQCAPETVAAWWRRLLDLKVPQVFDWLSLAKACDNPDRVVIFAEQVSALGPNLSQVRFDKLPFIEKALNGMGIVSAVSADKNLSSQGYSSDTVESEISARVAKVKVSA